MPRYRALLLRIASTPVAQQENNLQWKRLGTRGHIEAKYGHDELWSIRASREIRMLAAKDGADVTIVDFVRRNDRSVYAGQREHH